MMAFGAMMVTHLPISQRSSLVISTKIEKVIFGLVQKVLLAMVGHFHDMMERHCQITNLLLPKLSQERMVFLGFQKLVMEVFGSDL